MEYQNYLLSGILAFSGGLRREVISLLRIDKIQKENNHIGTSLSNEKVPRSNSSTIPLSKEFEIHIRIFIAFIREAIFTDKTPKGKYY